VSQLQKRNIWVELIVKFVIKMKALFFIIFSSLALNINAQWVIKNIDNGFDDPYKYAYSSEPKNRFIKIEPYDAFEPKVLFFLGGEYYCGDGPVLVELSFQVNGQNKKHSSMCKLFSIEEDDYVLISENLINEDYLSDFKASSTMKIRINDYDCESDDNIQTVYSFSMSGSSSALNFVLK